MIPLHLRRRALRGHDEGFTLVELIVALVIMAVAVSIIVGVMASEAIASRNGRGQATADGAIRSYADALAKQVAAQNPYVFCPTTTGGSPAILVPSAPDFVATQYPGVNVTVTEVDYWLPSNLANPMDPTYPQTGAWYGVTPSGSPQLQAQNECKSQQTSCTSSTGNPPDPTAFAACMPQEEMVTVVASASATSNAPATKTSFNVIVKRGNT